MYNIVEIESTENDTSNFRQQSQIIRMIFWRFYEIIGKIMALDRWLQTILVPQGLKTQMLDNNVYTFYFLKYYRITLYRYFRQGLDKPTPFTR